MSPLVAYHATRRCCRNSIREHGLFTNRPNPARPFGVYVYGDDFDHVTFSRGGTVYWGSLDREETWRVAYIGPLMPDEYVVNGLILLCPVPPEHLSLVSQVTNGPGT